jgi:hypothetical protein
MNMTARCCNELLAALDRTAELQTDRVEHLAELFEAAMRHHERAQAVPRLRQSQGAPMAAGEGTRGTPTRSVSRKQA